MSPETDGDGTPRYDKNLEPWRDVWRQAARPNGPTLGDLAAELRRMIAGPRPGTRSAFLSVQAATTTWTTLSAPTDTVALEDAGAVASALLYQLTTSAMALQALSHQVEAAAARGEITMPDLPRRGVENLATAIEGIVTVVFEVDDVVTRHGRRIVEQLQALGDS